MRPCSYKLVGRDAVPCDITAWGRCFDNFAERVIANTEIEPGLTVSTVFIGLDPAVEGPPRIFETMVRGGDSPERAWRYSTWAEAEVGHWKIVRELKAAQN